MICDPENDCEFALLDFLCVLKQFFIKGAGEGDLKESYGRIKVAKVPSKKNFISKLFKEKKKKNHEHIYSLLFFLKILFCFFGKEETTFDLGDKVGVPT